MPCLLMTAITGNVMTVMCNSQRHMTKNVFVASSTCAVDAGREIIAQMNTSAIPVTED